MYSPDNLVIIKECCVFNLWERSFYLVDEALDTEVSVLVQGQKVNAVKDVQNVTMLQVQCQQILEKNLAVFDTSKHVLAV